MKWKTYLKNAAVLTLTSLFLRLAGMLFRIYISGEIGAEGMGLYQLIFSIYTLSISLATSGITVAATRIVSEDLASGSPGQMKTSLGRVLWLGGALGIAAGACQFLLANPAAQFWLKDSRAVLPLQILAPSLPFMAIAAALRGYFMALRNVAPNSVAQILEQLLRIGLVAALLPPALPQGVEQACGAVVLGNTASEIVSCLIMMLYYQREKRKTLRGVVGEASPGIGKRMKEIILPISGGRVLGSALRTAENTLVPTCLTACCASRSTALAQYGALKGMAMPLLFFPFSLINAFSTLLMPEITEAHLQHHQKTMERLVGRVVLVTSLFSILAGGMIALYGMPLGKLLYKSEEVGFYLQVLGPIAPFMYLEGMVDGILKGLNEQMASFRYSMWDSVLRLALIVVLLPRMGIQGFLLVMVFSNAFTGLLNLRRLFAVTGIRVQWGNWLVKPLLCFALAAAANGLAISPLFRSLGLLPKTVCSMISLAAVDLCLVFCFGGLRFQFVAFRKRDKLKAGSER